MAMLKTTASHDSCSCYIQKYLEKETKGNRNRALAKDFLNLASWERTNWAYTMDRTREKYGLTGEYKGKRRRTYEHIIISPDPKDGIGLEDLRALATTYARTLFGDSGDDTPGLLGRAQVAIVYHDDNTNHIPHAHLVVNRVDLETGKALHFDNKDNTVLLPDTLQNIAKEMGLSYFDNSVVEEYDNEKAIAKGLEEINNRTPYLTKPERALLKDGKYSWKQHLRDTISVAARTTTTETQFLDTLKEFGVTAKQTARNAHGQCDWVFYMKENPTRWRCTGYRLGKGWSRQAIMAQQQDNLRRQDQRYAELHKNICDYVTSEARRNAVKAVPRPHGTHIPSSRAKEFDLNLYVPRSTPLYKVADIFTLAEALDLKNRDDFADAARQAISRAQLISEQEGNSPRAITAAHTAQRISEAVECLRDIDVRSNQKQTREFRQDNRPIQWVIEDPSIGPVRRRVDADYDGASHYGHQSSAPSQGVSR